MMQNEKRLRILFLAAWYPSEVNPVRGMFIKEHAKAASLHNTIVVLHASPDPFPQPKGVYRLSQDTEDGIRTIRLRYGGLIYYLRKLLVKKRKQIPAQGSSMSREVTFLSKVFAIPRTVIVKLLYYWSIIAAFRKLIKEGWKPDIIHAHVFTAGVPASSSLA